MVFVVVLAILAFVMIKSLMSVVARDEAATAAPWIPEPSTNDLTVELRATVNDDVRAFLLPAAPEPTETEREQAAFEQSLFDEIAANEHSR
jgi:Na+-transporting methylmalonyl-CoA/oxaloacetate decarboxylase gamma subunit